MRTKAYTDARMRLDAFWTIALIVATAAALKLTLPVSLADQIIAAYFVGQGFALQHHVKSYITGIQVRSNSVIWTALHDKGRICYEPAPEHRWTLTDQTVFSITLETRDTDNATRIVRVLPWTAVEAMTITC